MTPESHRRAKDLFLAVREMRPEDAGAFLIRECGGDAGLLAEVKSLLPHATDAAFVAGTDVPDSAPSAGETAAGEAPVPPLDGRRIGKFRLTRVIASGGMGTVYEALEEFPRRVVALKVMRAGIASPHALRRFDYEAQVLARLRHPGIAHIYEAGVHQENGDRVPYFAMEYIPSALTITAYAEQNVPGTRDRLELFAKVCDAVHHGHQKGVIHRDLKPSNILVDPSGQPKVIDFGVARSTDSDLAITTFQTGVGQLIGTLQYMSPEQCAPDPHDLDTRSDVYALGVVLFELLTGRPPYDLSRAPIHEAARVIREDPPARPSTILRSLRGDAETITLKALEKDRGRRYDSAAALADDLRRYLHSEPIAARPPSLTYQVRMFARRNRALFNGSLAVLLVLLLGVGTSTWGFVGQRRQRMAAEQRRTEVERVAEFQARMLGGIDPQLMGSRLRQDLLGEARAMREQAGMEPARIDAEVADLERLLAGANFTNLGVKSLDRNVLQKALEAIETQFAHQPAVQAQLLQTSADTLLALGLYDAAAAPQQRALQIRRSALGDDAADTLTSMQNTGIVLLSLNRLAEAEALFDESLRRSRRVLGDDHPTTLTCINNMGMLLVAEGKLAEAETYYLEGLERSRRVLGDDTPDTLNSISGMGSLLYQQGRMAEAEPYLREAYEKNPGVLGSDHAGTVKSINNMGMLLMAMGRLAEAEPIAMEAMDESRRVFGDDHPDTILAINNAGWLLLALQKMPQAEPYLRESLSRGRRVLGDDHPVTLRAIDNLGTLLLKQAKPADAEPYTREALEKRRHALGDDHPDTLTSMITMGAVLAAQGRLDDAEPYIRGALEQRRRILREGHPETLSSMINLADLLRKQGKPAEAEPLYREAVAGFERMFGPDDYLVANGRLGWGVVLTALQRFAEAEEALTQAERVLKSSPRAPAGRHQQCIKALVTLYDAWEKTEPGQGHDASTALWRDKVEQ